MTHKEKRKLIEETIKIMSREDDGRFASDDGKQMEFYRNLRDFLANQLADWQQLKKL